MIFWGSGENVFMVFFMVFRLSFAKNFRKNHRITMEPRNMKSYVKDGGFMATDNINHL
jgi:hypothetical protein